MKKLYITFLFFGFSAHLVCAQNFWQNASGAYNGGIGAYCIDSNNVIYAYFNSGQAMKTTNFGVTWNPIGITFTTPPTEFKVKSDNTLFLGIYRSTNNGTSWIQVTIPGKLFFHPNGDLYSSQNNVGIYRSTNNGSSWTLYLSINTLRDFQLSPAGIFYYKELSGSNLYLYRSTNSGLDWTLYHTRFGDVSNFCFLDEQPCGIINSGASYISTGSQSSVIPPDGDTRFGSYQSLFQNNNSIIGVFYYSNAQNSGLNRYDVIQIPGTYPNNCINFRSNIDAISSNNLFSIARYGGQLLSYRATQGWNSINSGFSSTSQIQFLNDTLYALSNSSVVKTTDLGISWQTVKIDSIDFSSKKMNANGYILGRRDEPGGPRMCLSTNLGRTWSNITPTAQAIHVYEYCDNGYVLACLENYNSSDCGVWWYNNSNWSNVSQRTSSLTTMRFHKTSDNYQYYSDDQNNLYRASNFQNWSTIYTFAQTLIKMVSVRNGDLIAFVRGQNFPNRTYRSTDHGSSWTLTNQSLPFNTLNINNVFVDNWDRIILSLSDSAVYMSSDYCLNWSHLNTGLSSQSIMQTILSTGGFLFSTNGSQVFRSMNSVKPISITHPNGSDIVQNGNQDSICWTSFGMAGNLRIDINRNYPAGNWDTLFYNVANTGRLAWTVIGDTSTRARIRISSILQPTIGDSSDLNFSIQGLPDLYKSLTSVNFSNICPISIDSILLLVANRSNLPFRYLTITGASSGVFSRRVMDTDSLTNVNDTLRIWVRFRPDTTITFRDTLRLTFESPYYPITIPISGTGVGVYTYLVDTAFTFPHTIEPTLRDSLRVRFRVAGNDTLRGATTVNVVPFSFSATTIPNTRPGDTVSIWLYFNPTTQGVYTRRLPIVVHAINTDTLWLTANCTSSYVPAAPGHLTVTTQGENANLTWNRVDTSQGGVPVTVQRYLIYYRNNNTTPWYYLWATFNVDSTSFTHISVVRYSPAMYYQVTAWLGTGSTDSFD